MALKDIVQPEFIPIDETLRLRKYDGRSELFLPGYQDPCVYQNSEGIFDAEKIPDLSYVQRMCSWLSAAGELYYIETWEQDRFIPIGDVTIKPENPPIAIWRAEYRGQGIGYRVMCAVIHRLRSLGYQKITGSTVYQWNTASQRLHEKLGFVCTRKEDREWAYELIL